MSDESSPGFASIGVAVPLDCNHDSPQMELHCRACVADLRAQLTTERQARLNLERKLLDEQVGHEAALAARDEDVRTLVKPAQELVLQVEEFDTWDEKDWPAAISCLRGHADAFRAALARVAGAETGRKG